MTRSLVKVIAVIAVGSSFGGCSAPGWRRLEPVTAQRDLVVEIEQRTFKGDPVDLGYSHPCEVDRGQITALLEALRYSRRGREETSPVVDRVLIGRLGSSIAEGLARADASQRVRFSFHNPGKALWVFPINQTTRGVAFVEPGGLLNLAWDLLDESLDWEDPVWGDPTRTIRTRADLHLPATASLRRAESGEEKRLWLTAPVNALALVSPEGSGAQSRKLEDRVDSLLEAAKPPSEPGKGTSSGGSKESTDQEPIETEPSSGSPISESLTDRQILDRLRVLELRRKEGLISEEEYTREKRQLLFPR